MSEVFPGTPGNMQYWPTECIATDGNNRTMH